jgi:hypothetical protein
MGLDLQLAWDLFVYTVLCMAIYRAESKSPARCPHTHSCHHVEIGRLDDIIVRVVDQHATLLPRRPNTMYI